MKKILFVAAALAMTSSVASAGSITFTDGVATNVNLTYTANDIGGGLTRYDVFLDDPTDAKGSYFAQLLTFTGIINQDASGTKANANKVPVDTFDNANNFDGINYDMTQDSFFFGPFTDNLTAPGPGTLGIQDIAPGSNPLVANPANAPEGLISRSYLINGGSGGGSLEDQLQIAQIVASGNVTVSGGIGRSGGTKVLTIGNNGGTGVMSAVTVPEPSSFVLLGMGAVGLTVLARRRKAA